MKHFLRLLPLLLVLLVTGCSESTDPGTSTKTYRIGMVPWAAYSPLNVADAKGYWKDQGIEVEVVSYNANTDLNQALIDGKIDLALDMIGSWVDLHLQNKPVVIVGETDWSNGGDKIIVKSGVNVASLKGSKLGVYLNMLSVKNFVSQYLISQGLSLSDFAIEEVSHPDTLSARFIDGTYSIIANYDPAAAKAITAGNGVVAATSADYAGCIPEGFAMREDKPVDHADLVKIFKGWASAVEWAMAPANKTEFYQILRTKTFGNASMTDTELESNLSQVRIHARQEQRNINSESGALKSFVTDLLTFAKTNGFPNHTETSDHLLETSAAEAALQ